jgi:hypothetical protein
MNFCPRDSHWLIGSAAITACCPGTRLTLCQLLKVSRSELVHAFRLTSGSCQRAHANVCAWAVVRECVSVQEEQVHVRPQQLHGLLRSFKPPTLTPVYVKPLE